MMLNTKKLPIPGLLWGVYPEQSANVTNNHALNYFFDRFIRREKSKVEKLIREFRLLENSVASFNSKTYQSELEAVQINLRRDGFKDQHVAKCFALISKAFAATMDINLFDTQVTAAYHLLNSRLTEMATGEGKTFAVALASATAALSGVPIHVITANDYLADRDAASMQKLYQALDITVDAATQGQTPNRRKHAYACDITYCTAKELVFDYLRDDIQRKKQPDSLDKSVNNTLLLRGLCMAIIDEADSILIDEARVPLILSQAVKNEQENQYLEQSLNLADSLKVGEDFLLNTGSMKATLTGSGSSKLETAALTLSGVWHNRLHREETVSQALAASYLYHRDQHYIVHDGKVQIIDETTGRVAKGRAWSKGLHQLIELKENIEPSDRLETISQITYQRFFPKYHRLSGISGTIAESRNELFNTYGLCMSKVALRSASQRKIFPTRLFTNKNVLNNALIERINMLKKSGRPILVGMDSVKDSETLSEYLKIEGISHVVLNAKNDEDEADLIAKAGATDAVTITTNMAGRGTDIKLEAGVNALGGLHVISCQVNHSRRIDRQLIGRSARQGDQGSAETWVALNNDLLLQRLPKWLHSVIRQCTEQLPNYIIKPIIFRAQKAEERHQALLRKHLLKNDKKLENNLSFGVSA